MKLIISSTLNNPPIYFSKLRNICAQQVLADVDPEMANRFRGAYVDTMTREGDTLFRQRMFSAAAQKYEAAANWANMELKDDNLSAQIYERAIETWVSACEFQNSFRIMQQLDHQTKHEILARITVRITQAADYLISINKASHAKAQLYLAINVYQREGFFEELKLINNKLLGVLKVIIVDALRTGESALAKLTLDEFDNILLNFEVPDQPDVSIEIAQMVQMFIDQVEFSVVDELIPRIDDINAQREATEKKVAKEESLAADKKASAANFTAMAAGRVDAFVKAEIAFIYEQNDAILQTVTNYENQGDYRNAADTLKCQADWLAHAKYEEIASEFYVILLQFYLRANFVREFLANISNIAKEQRDGFLLANIQNIVDSLNRTYQEQNITETRLIFEKIVKLYRQAELFDGTRLIANIMIEILKAEASRVIELVDTRGSIEEALQCLKQAQEISDSLVDGEKIFHDQVYKKVTQKYIDLADTMQAESTLQKIKDKAIYTELHEHLLAVEASRAKPKISEAKGKVEAGMTQEQLSLLWSRAREVAMSKEEGLKKRTGLKRRIFQECLDALRENKVPDAITAYLNTSDAFIQRKMFDEAGLTIAVACLLDLTQGHVGAAEFNLTETVKKAKTSQPVLEESFPIRIIRFVIDMYKYWPRNRSDGGLCYAGKFAIVCRRARGY